jgi:hypothetical protein
VEITPPSISNHFCYGTTGEAEDTIAEKNPKAVARGRLGGQKGGVARAKKLTPDERTKIARRAAKARWKNS